VPDVADRSERKAVGVDGLETGVLVDRISRDLVILPEAEDKVGDVEDGSRAFNLEL
jgi:hypothetical protein